VSGNKLALLSKDSGLYFFNATRDKWISIPTVRQLLGHNAGPLLFFRDHLYAGTQTGGVFYSRDEGKTWRQLNTGLHSLAIRRFAEVGNKLLAATDSGLYSFNEFTGQWELEFGNSSLQVNGITALAGHIYIATNQGAFVSSTGKRDWKKIFSKGALHNISTDDQALYAMVYNELFSSSDRGNTWQSVQHGLPAQLYTFNVVKSGDWLLAGQWDGVYRKNRGALRWEYSGRGLPAKLAIVNMQVYNRIIVVSGSERILKTAMNTGK
jgi:ligand-binding sensor domain-containing protein